MGMQRQEAGGSETHHVLGSKQTLGQVERRNWAAFGVCTSEEVWDGLSVGRSRRCSLVSKPGPRALPGPCRSAGRHSQSTSQGALTAGKGSKGLLP